MKQEIILGGRLLFVECDNGRRCSFHDGFLNFLIGHEGEIKNIMDDYEIPEQIVLNFKKGELGLDGLYHIQKKEVRKHVIVIDVYTNHFNEGILVEELLDTFIHELVHHKVKSDKETTKITRRIVGGILGKK